MEGARVDHDHINPFLMHGAIELRNGKWKQMDSANEKYFDSYEVYCVSNDNLKADTEKLNLYQFYINKIV